MNRASPFADDPVSANQENTRELRENRRRRSRFILPAPRHLAAELSKLIAQPTHLTAMAANAKSAGIPDAADRLADLVIATAHSTN